MIKWSKKGGMESEKFISIFIGKKPFYELERFLIVSQL